MRTPASGLSAAVVAIAVLLACDKGGQTDSPTAAAAAEPSPASTADSFLVEESTVVRVPVFGRGRPVIGHCVHPLTGVPHSGICSEALYKAGAPMLPGKFARRILQQLPDAQYEERSEVLDIAVDVNADVLPVKSENSVRIVRYRLIKEWSRFRTLSAVAGKPGAGLTSVGALKTGGLAEESRLPVPDTEPDVDIDHDAMGTIFGIDYGIAVRIIVELSITQASSETSASFGFGDLAAAVQAGRVKAKVKYETIGVSFDIMPENFPTSIESLHDLTAIEAAFQSAISKISFRWNDSVDAFLAMRETETKELSQCTEQARHRRPTASIEHCKALSSGKLVADFLLDYFFVAPVAIYYLRSDEATRVAATRACDLQLRLRGSEDTDAAIERCVEASFPTKLASPAADDDEDLPPGSSGGGPAAVGQDPPPPASGV